MAPGIGATGRSYLTLAALMFATTWLAPGARWIGLDGDPDSTMWSIQWVAYAAVHDLNPGQKVQPFLS